MEPEGDDAEQVLRAIRRIVRRIAEYSRTLAREVGLSVPQLLCLKAVGELQGDEAEVTVARVAEHVQLGAPTVSRIVERLVQAGLIARERRARDRRKVCLSLTPRGHQRWQTLPQPLQETFMARFEGLGPQRRQQILDALQEVGRMMEATGLDAAPLLTPGLDVRSEDQ